MLAFIAVLATVVPLIHSNHWYIRVFDYPRLQTFFIAVLALAWYLIFHFKKRPWGYGLLAVLVIAIFIQGYKAFPYTPFGEKQVLWADTSKTDSNNISLFISNVLQKNDSYNLVLEKIHKYNPDLIITTETNKEWQKALSVLYSEYPYRVEVPKDNQYGMLLFSKLELDSAIVRYLLSPGIPSIRTRVHLRSGEWIHLFVVHPRPPFPSEADDSRERDAEILMVGREARKETDGVIVAGDFNDVAWSKNTDLFQEVTGYLDPRRGRGFFNTFDARYPVFRWPLDHIFHSAQFRLVDIERVGKVNSDHFPMYVQLNYRPNIKRKQPDVHRDEDTREQANEAIRKGKKNARIEPDEQ